MVKNSSLKIIPSNFEQPASKNIDTTIIFVIRKQENGIL